jgi:hypothetical protein
MNRKAAIDKLLLVAEETAASGQYKISNTINDLARRIALSSYKMSDKQVIRENVSRMAAELMFRDNFKMAKMLTKIAEDLNIDEDTESAEDTEIPPALMTPEEAAQSNQDYIAYLEARLQDPDLSDFEREQILQKLNESSAEPKTEEPVEEEAKTTNFLDTMRDLGVSIRLPKDLLD